MALNKKYSYRDFAGQDFSDRTASEFNNSEIVGSCFYQDGETNKKIFPAGMIGVTFIKCNLDNIFAPATCAVDGGCHRSILCQNDLEDWIVDENDNPIEPLDKVVYESLGISTDPKDISITKLAESPLRNKKKERAELEAK